MRWGTSHRARRRYVRIVYPKEPTASLGWGGIVARMDVRSSPAGGLRAITREAVRDRITEHALILFDENGFEQTTIEDIVTAVGISACGYF